MKYKLIVFDMDGTILDTLEDLTISLNYALELSGLPLHSIDEVRRYVGNGIGKLIERGVPAHSPESVVKTVYRDFTEHYAVHCNDHTKPYAGITELLTDLKTAGCLQAVVSNKADYAVQELCEMHFQGLFDYAVGEREGIRRKPEPDSVNEVLRRLDIRRGDAVYIGDSDVDIETARNAGLSCISVSWGFRSIDFLKKHGAACIVNTTDQLWKKLAEKPDGNESVVS